MATAARALSPPPLPPATLWMCLTSAALCATALELHFHRVRLGLSDEITCKGMAAMPVAVSQSTVIWQLLQVRGASPNPLDSY